MKLKRILFVYILAATALLPLRAQDFQLYFANNVSDVVNFAKIESDLSGLTWREVKNGDMAGNQVEVDAVKRMFASTAKKIISTNTMLVENQNTLLEQNKVLAEKLQESKEALDNATSHSQGENGQWTIDNGVYDLSGRRFEGLPTQKGLYIVNGKKVAIK